MTTDLKLTNNILYQLRQPQRFHLVLGLILKAAQEAKKESRLASAEQILADLLHDESDSDGMFFTTIDLLSLAKTVMDLYVDWHKIAETLMNEIREALDIGEQILECPADCQCPCHQMSLEPHEHVNCKSPCLCLCHSRVNG